MTLFAACQTLDILIHGDNSAWTLVGAYADVARWYRTLVGRILNKPFTHATAEDGTV
ncbi:hypothetical protein AB0L00_38070 [Actinoallomurus sp. NPDC052308]|uniref:hypothetical protein n=1 Tax=Actinoallomurus sp. NPDC052308 TaxID=3155530 RepID=UPI003424CCA8